MAVDPSGPMLDVCRHKAIAAMLREGGFEEPVLFSQSLLIHAWFARRRPDTAG